PPVPGALQVVPGPDGRPPVDRVPLCRAQRAAWRLGPACRGVALVQLVAAPAGHGRGAGPVEPVAGGGAAGVGGVGQRSADGRGSRSATALCAPGPTIRRPELGVRSGRAAGAAKDPAAPRKAEETTTHNRFLTPFLGGPGSGGAYAGSGSGLLPVPT